MIDGFLSVDLEMNLRRQHADELNQEFSNKLTDYDQFEEGQFPDFQDIAPGSSYEDSDDKFFLSLGTTEKLLIDGNIEQEASLASRKMEETKPKPLLTKTTQGEDKELQCSDLRSVQESTNSAQSIGWEAGQRSVQLLSDLN